MAEIPDEVRKRLALVLDLDDLVEATRLARELQPWFGVVKVGLELFSATGPDSVVALADLGFTVFVDLKLCDIPTTVGKAARVLGGLGAGYLTMHAFGGPVMLRAGNDGLAEGAAGAALPKPTSLAVTILTSDDTAPPHVLGSRVRSAMEGGCGGIVCAAADVVEAKRLAPRLVAVVPGIRLPGADPNDQARAATPETALAAGANLLVVGRTVTRAGDRAAAAAAVAGAVATSMAASA